MCMAKIALVLCGTLSLLGCNLLGQDYKTSECGGFEDHGGLTAEEYYCEAERVYWEYQSDTEKLRVTNTRVGLNCCGDHSMEMSAFGNKINILELDKPRDVMGSRCMCSCVYDFEIVASGIAENEYEVKIERRVENLKKNEEEVVFEGKWNLKDGKGMVEITRYDLDNDYFCLRDRGSPPQDAGSEDI